MELDSIPPVFEWWILALASFRLQRVITTDDWPPSKWFRKLLVKNIKGSKFRKWIFIELETMFTCPWCFGSLLTFAVFAEHVYLDLVPLLVYAAFAAAGVVGLLGTYDERPDA